MSLAEQHIKLSHAQRHKTPPLLVKLLLAPLIILCVVVMFLTVPFYVAVLIAARNKGVGGNGSITMFGVAQQRLLGYRAGVCNDFLAYLVVPRFYRVYEWIQMITWQLYGALFDKAYGAVRCAYIDEVLERSLEDGIVQVVNLGAGMDTRLHRFNFAGNVKLFEVDAHSSQALKLEMLPARYRNSAVVFVSCNFETESWKEKLQQNGFEPGQKTLFIWEGVSMYLTREALSHTLALIAEAAPASRVVFDYFERPQDLAMRIGVKTMELIGEPMHSLITPATLSTICDAASLEIREDWDAEEITNRYLRHEAGHKIGTCLPLAHFVTADVS